MTKVEEPHYCQLELFANAFIRKIRTARRRMSTDISANAIILENDKSRASGLSRYGFLWGSTRERNCQTGKERLSERGRLPLVCASRFHAHWFYEGIRKRTKGKLFPSFPPGARVHSEAAKESCSSATYRCTRGNDSIRSTNGTIKHPAAIFCLLLLCCGFKVGKPQANFAYAGPSASLFLGSPDVVYTGHKKVTIAFETIPDFESYKLVLFQSDWQNICASPETGRNLTLSTPLVASPVVLRPDNFTTFAPQYQKNVDNADPCIRHAPHDANGVLENPSLSFPSDYCKYHLVLLLYTARIIGVRPDKTEICYGPTSCKFGVTTSDAAGTATARTICAPQTGTKSCMCTPQINAGSILPGDQASKLFKKIVAASAPSDVGGCGLFGVASGSSCDPKYGMQQANSARVHFRPMSSWGTSSDAGPLCYLIESSTDHRCSSGVSVTQQVAGELADTTRTHSNGNIEPKTIHCGGLAMSVTYFARVVPFTYFRGIASAVSLGQMVVESCLPGPPDAPIIVKPTNVQLPRSNVPSIDVVLSKPNNTGFVADDHQVSWHEAVNAVKNLHYMLQVSTNEAFDPASTRESAIAASDILTCVVNGSSMLSENLIMILSSSSLLLTVSRFTSQTKRLKIKSSRAFHIMFLLLMSGFWCSTVRAEPSHPPPTFTTKNISQSNPLAGQSNTITVTIVTDANLSATDNSVVTITGLSNAVASTPITLIDRGDDGENIFSNGTTRGTGAWSSGTLTLTVYTGLQLSSGIQYTFAFAVTNPSSAQPAPAISIQASGLRSFAPANMTTPNSNLIGVTYGANPLLIVVPTFTVKSIQQSTFVSGANNTMTVTLTANVDLLAESTVTITGLTGSQTPDSASLAVTSTSSLLGTTGVWNQSSGQLVLTAASGGTTSGTACEVTFNLTNPATAQSSPAVSVSATLANSVGTIAGDAMTKPGALLYGVANGSDPLTVAMPAFSVKSIQQSTPMPSANNTMTVTLTASYSLAFGSTVTITGLTGSQTPDSASLAVTSTSSLLGTTGVWNQSSGQLVLTAASGGTTSGTACEVTFNLTNPATAQSSPAVSVSATLANSVGTIAEAAMTKPGALLYGVANGSDPLTVAMPAFSVKSIQQSTPMPSANNTMTVTLTASYSLAFGSTVTITGLTGSQTPDSASLAVTSTSSLLGTTGVWNQSSGQLVLTAASGGTTSETACEVRFNLTNPATAQSSPAVSVSATLANSVGTIAEAAMTKPGALLYGVANGSDPLTVAMPAFSVKSIQQSTPVPSANNTMTVTLTASYSLAFGSTVTITGLTGSQTPDSASLAVTSTSSLLGTTGVWNQSSGQLVLTAASGGTTSGTACEVRFNLTNPATAQSSPAVSVSATLANSVGTIAEAAMTKPGALLYGVANGSDPLTVAMPAFSVKSIQQSTPMPSANNTMTVTLTASYSLAFGSTVTITGLTGSQTPDSASLAVTSTSSLLGTTGVWNQSSGQLVLTAASGGTTSGTACEVRFNLTNPATAQSSPAVSVSATLANSVGTIAEAAMTKPGALLYGVANGSDPLTVAMAAFSVKSIQQSTPMPSANNTMTVTLTASYSLAFGSTVTITGLTGSQTPDSASLAVTSTSSLLGTTGKWNQSSGQLVLTAASGGTTSGTACEVRFNLTNPATAQSSPAVSVSATLANSVGTIAEAAMTKPGALLYGVANGSDPLTVAMPAFSVKSIQQSTPVPSANNTMTVTLTASYSLAFGSTVTITGLTGSQTPDSASLAVTSTSSLLGTTGKWNQSSGQLVLTAASGGTTSGTACEVRFILTNPATAQSSPAVSVSATLANSVGTIAEAAMTKPGALLYGVANCYLCGGVPYGTDPLTVALISPGPDEEDVASIGSCPAGSSGAIKSGSCTQCVPGKYSPDFLLNLTDLRISAGFKDFYPLFDTSAQTEMVSATLSEDTPRVSEGRTSVRLDTAAISGSGTWHWGNPFHVIYLPKTTHLYGYAKLPVLRDKGITLSVNISTSALNSALVDVVIGNGSSSMKGPTWAGWDPGFEKELAIKTQDNYANKWQRFDVVLDPESQQLVMTINCHLFGLCSSSGAKLSFRYFGLVIWQTDFKFASVSTRANPPSDSNSTSHSSSKPNLDPSGGPRGKACIRFTAGDRQWLDAEKRTLNMTSNGGLTIAVVVRFQGLREETEKIIEFGSIGSESDRIILGRKRNSNKLWLKLVQGFEWEGAEIVPAAWMTIVVSVKGFKSVHEVEIRVNNVTVHKGFCAPLLPDITMQTTRMGGGINGSDHFSGDIAGAFVLDEYLGATTILGVTEAMHLGQDLMEYFGMNTISPCNYGGQDACIPHQYGKFVGKFFTNSKFEFSHISSVVLKGAVQAGTGNRTVWFADLGAVSNECALCIPTTYSATLGATLRSTCQECAKQGWSPFSSSSSDACVCEKGTFQVSNCGSFGLSNDTCSRFLGLVLANATNFASVSTRNNAPLGSTTLPSYDAFGGPLGKGHISFNRTLTQFLDSGTRTFKIASNSGLTMVAVVRFKGLAGTNETIFELGGAGSNNTIVLARKNNSSALRFMIFNSSSAICIWNGGEIVQDTWMTVVVRYVSGTTPPPKIEVWINEVMVGNVSCTENVPDITVFNTYMGRSSSTEFDAYLNADVAGAFVVDDYLNTATALVAAGAIQSGVDLMADYTGSETKCVKCPHTTTTAQVGSAGINQCVCKAGFGGNLSGTTCTVCSSGTYKTWDGLGACDLCPAALPDMALVTTTEDGQECACKFGAYRLHGSTNKWDSRPPSSNIECDLCEAGKTKNFIGDGLWVIKEGKWSYKCDVCQKGTYQPYTGRSACFNCPSGTYNNKPGRFQSECFVCKSCPKNTYSEQASDVRSDCVANAGYTGRDGYDASACPVNTYKAVNGSTGCQQCQKIISISFSPLASINCTCSLGHFSQVKSTDGANCTPCAIGYAANETGMSQCTRCPYGTYTSNFTVASTACVTCPDSSFTDVTGARRVQECNCNAGYSGAPPDSNCTACDRGTYKNVTGPRNCTMCQEGKYQSLLAQTVCLDCRPNAWSSPGTISSGGTGSNESMCVCNKGYGWDTLTLPQPGYWNASRKEFTCLQDAPGEWVHAYDITNITEFSNVSVCQSCKAGKYGGGGNVVCLQCPENSSSTKDAMPACPCLYGHVRLQASNVAAPCAVCTLKTDNININFIHPLAAQNVTTTNINSTCDAGRYWKDCSVDGDSGCYKCPDNSWSLVGAQGLTECLCDMGYTGPNGGPCTKCPANFYKNTTGDANCTDCPGIRMSPEASSLIYNCTCPVGYETDFRNAHFLTTHNDVVSVDIYANSTQAVPFEDRCMCTPGYHRTSFAFQPPVVTWRNLALQPQSERCRACNPGEFNNYSAATTCNSCDSGFFANQNAMTVCSLCASISSCPTGQYWEICPGVKDGHCKQCTKEKMPGNTSFSGPGSAGNPLSCPYTCSAGFDSVPIADQLSFGNPAACSACPIGKYRGTHLGACTTCPNHTTTLEEGGVYCTSCTQGFCFNGFRTDGHADCIECPSMNSTSQPDAHALDFTDRCRCKPGYDGFAWSCSPCRPGTYKSVITNSSDFYMRITGDVGISDRCLSCDGGSFNPNWASTGPGACTLCNADSSTHGDTSRCSCNMGYWDEGNGPQSSCKACPANTYNDLIGRASKSFCRPCPDPHHYSQTANPSQENCHCNAGFQGNFSYCTKCPYNTYSTKTDNQCIDCPNGTITIVESKISIQVCVCPANMYGVINVSNWKYRPPYYDWQQIGPHPCTPCPSNSFSSPGSTVRSQCVCQAGLSGNPAEGLGCSGCPPQTYPHIDAKYCSCNAGYYDDFSGGNSTKFIRVTNLSPYTCTKCPSFSYSAPASIGVDKCHCNNGYFGEPLASNSSHQNSSGRFFIKEPCQKCPNNSYSIAAEPKTLAFCSCNVGFSGDPQRSIECEPCAANSYTHTRTTLGTILTTSTPSADINYYDSEGDPITEVKEIGTCTCNHGYYGYLYNISLSLSPSLSRSLVDYGRPCSPCPIGTYNPLHSQKFFSACLLCQAHSTTDFQASDRVSDCKCHAGYYHSGTSCEACEAGKYQASRGQHNCTMCILNSISMVASTDSTACKCKPGYYRTGGPSPNGDCVSCPAGKHKSFVGDVECDTCPANSSATSNRMSCSCDAGFYGGPEPEFLGGCNACPAGTKQPLINQFFSSACIACPVHAISAPGSSECRCGTKFYGNLTNTSGTSAGCNACPQGSSTSSAISITTRDDCLCDEGYFGENNTICKLCPENSTSPRNTTNFQGCICTANFYGNHTACKQCPDNAFSPMGSLLLEDCRCRAGFFGTLGSAAASAKSSATTSQANTANSCKACYKCPDTHYGVLLDVIKKSSLFYDWPRSQNFDPFPDTTPSSWYKDPVALACRVAFPHNISDGLLWLFGGAGPRGASLGLKNASTTPTLRLRAGLNTNNLSSWTVLDVTDFPADDEFHEVVAFIACPGPRIALYIDGILKGNATGRATCSPGEGWATEAKESVYGRALVDTPDYNLEPNFDWPGGEEAIGSNLRMWNLTMFPECAGGFANIHIMGNWSTGEGVEAVCCQSCGSQKTSTGYRNSSTSCVCNAGYTGPNGGTCKACAKDTYKDSHGSQECTSCAYGEYTVATGSARCIGSACKACPLGAISVEASTVLQNCTCKAGFYGNASKGVACKTCPSSSYSLKSALIQADCVCNQGFYGNPGLNVACESCPQHSAPLPYLNFPRVIQNCSCNAGFYGSPTRFSVPACQGCPANTFNRNSGMKTVANCSSCPNHSFAVANSTICLCNRGFFGDLSIVGQTCEKCPADTYGPTEGAISQGKCRFCPANSFRLKSVAVSVDDCECIAGFSKWVAGIKVGQCQVCPDDNDGGCAAMNATAP